MTKNEQRFLRELHDLFSKYSIDLVKVDQTDHRIVLYSNKRRFIFAMYNEGAFIDVTSEIEEFVPYRDDKEAHGETD